MNDSVTVYHLRKFLLCLSGGLFAGTIVELALAEHVGSLIQIAPFGICVLGLLALAVVWVRPCRASVIALRSAMGIAVLGSSVGVYEHFATNLEFGRETQPNADAVQLVFAALTGGSPLLAPGILVVAAAVAIAATYALLDSYGNGTWRPGKPDDGESAAVLSRLQLAGSAGQHEANGIQTPERTTRRISLVHRDR